MKDKLSISTEICSYFLWEYTKHESALDLWYCAEDIGFFLAKSAIFTHSQITSITKLSKDELGYIEFVRHIAYRIYSFTGKTDMNSNWFAAEKLLNNFEWIESVVGIANIYVEIHSGEIGLADIIRSEHIKKHLNT